LPYNEIVAVSELELLNVGGLYDSAWGVSLSTSRAME